MGSRFEGAQSIAGISELKLTRLAEAFAIGAGDRDGGSEQCGESEGVDSDEEHGGRLEVVVVKSWGGGSVLHAGAGFTGITARGCNAGFDGN